MRSHTKINYPKHSQDYQLLVLKERDIPVLQCHSASDKKRLSYDNTLTNLRSIVVDEYLHGEGVPHSQASAALFLHLLSHKADGDQLQQWLPAQDLLVCCSKGNNKFMKCIILLCMWKFQPFCHLLSLAKKFLSR